MFHLKCVIAISDYLLDNINFSHSKGLVDKPGILVLTSISYVKIGSVRS